MQIRKVRQKRAGRKRKLADRHKSGQIKRAQKSQPPEMLILRRAEAVGGLNAEDPRCATALGILFLLGIIEQEHYDAGLRFEKVCNAYSRMIGNQSPHIVASKMDERLDRSPKQLAGDDFNKSREKYLAILSKLSNRQRQEIFTIIKFDRVPAWVLRRQSGQQRLGDVRRERFLVDSLAVLIDAF